MINRVVLVGRLTKDPVLRRTPNGTSVASFTVACDRRNKVEGQPTADFINCVVWGRVAENTATYTHKGSLVGVEGRIQTRSYDDQSGKKVYVTEIVAETVQFLEPKGNSNQQAATYQAQQGFNAGYQNQGFNQNAGYQANAGFNQANDYGYSNDMTQGYANTNQNNAYASDFTTSTGLDIASDDLPF